MKPVGRDLPSGTVTFLFTDVEGSTKLLHELGAAAYAAAPNSCRSLVEPSTSVNKKVTVPEGRSRTTGS